MLDKFLKSYWEYYLDLEKQVLETKRFVEFDKANKNTYSVEYLKLYQAICSEIDVVGREIACTKNQKFDVSNATIKKWGFEVQSQFPQIDSVEVIFNEEIILQPFKNWKYEPYTDSQGHKGLRIVDGKTTITWWHNYNAVKHQRVGLVKGTKNYAKANQKNLISALSALYILETKFIESLSSNTTSEIALHYEKSRLLKYK